MAQIQSSKTYIQHTQRELYPKRSLLRPFPAAIERALVTNTKPERIIFKHNQVISLDAFSHPFRHLAFTIPSRVHGILIISGKASDTFALQLISVTVGRDASFHLVQAVQGGARAETHAVINLAGQGAGAQVSGMFHARGEEQQSFHVLMHHQVPNTTGNIFIRGVYEQQSKGVFSGLIKVAPDAQKTNSYFADNVLLLDEAVAESLPTLEIEANDVKASHGSTTSKIDEEQLFYLRSRGVSGPAATQMIIKGFFHPVLARLPQTIQSTLLPL